MIAQLDIGVFNDLKDSVGFILNKIYCCYKLVHLKMNHSSATYDQSLPCILVIGDSNVVQLDVDSEVNHVVGPLNPKSVDHREPVFVGGVPGKSCLKGQVPNAKNSKFSSVLLQY